MSIMKFPEKRAAQGMETRDPANPVGDLEKNLFSYRGVPPSTRLSICSAKVRSAKTTNIFRQKKGSYIPPIFRQQVRSASTQLPRRIAGSLIPPNGNKPHEVPNSIGKHPFHPFVD